MRQKFEVQPVNREGLPQGELLQISVPNETSDQQFQLLIQAFVQAMKIPHPPPESYWANNVFSGIGKGAKSFAWGVARGIGGIVYDPINETVKRGVIGLPVGVAKGVGGLVGRPVKGCFDLFAQPVVGCIKTPGFVYDKLIRPEDTIKPSK